MHGPRGQKGRREIHLDPRLIGGSRVRGLRKLIRARRGVIEFKVIERKIPSLVTVSIARFLSSIKTIFLLSGISDK